MLLLFVFFQLQVVLFIYLFIYLFIQKYRFDISEGDNLHETSKPIFFGGKSISKCTVSAIKFRKRLTKFKIMKAMPKKFGSKGFIKAVKVTKI